MKGNAGHNEERDEDDGEGREEQSASQLERNGYNTKEKKKMGMRMAEERESKREGGAEA